MSIASAKSAASQETTHRAVQQSWTEILNNMFKMTALPEKSRNHLTAFLSELAGTFLFLLFAFAIAQTALTPPTPADDLPNLMKIFFISLGFGCSLTVNVWLFYRVSGGMFNPAVSLSPSYDVLTVTRLRSHSRSYSSALFHLIDASSSSLRRS